MAIDPKFLRFAGNALSDLGVGMTRGYNFRNGLQQATQRTAEMQPQRDAWAATQEAEAERQAQLQAAVENMQKINPQIAAIVASGGMDITTGWNETLKGMHPQAGPELTAEQKNWQYGQENPGFMDFITPEQKAAAPPSGFQWTPEGTLGAIPGGPASEEFRQKDPTLNANQSAAALYVDRMIQADQILSNPALAPAMMDPANPALASVPFLGNGMVSSEYQQAEQAQRDFINAVLRRESGATIQPAEFENAKKQYFPQPFDSQAVIDQKAANRKTAIEGIARAAGPAYQMPGGDPNGGYVAPSIEDILKKYQ